MARRNKEILFFLSVFKKDVFLEEFRLGPQTKRADLISCLEGLGFFRSDLVSERGEFCDRGMGVDFFPKGSNIIPNLSKSSLKSNNL